MNKETKKKESIIRNNAVQTILASLLCIVVGLLIGYVVLLIINPKGASGAIVSILKNYLYYPSSVAVMKYCGTTLVKASALLLCSLSVIFAYKVGLFNIGAAGQYVIGAGAALYFALKFNMPWYACMIAAVVLSALVGGLSGFLKAYFNVNEVISCIMLNWISLYGVNMLLSQVKAESTPYTIDLSSGNKSALMPNAGLDQIFSGNKFVIIGLPLAVIMAVVVWVILEKTKFGFELKATGMNKNAAKYCGMKEKRNTIVTMMIAGGLSGLGAAVFYLSGIETWMVQQTTVPGMGFNGIAAAFLGGLNPIGTIFSSVSVKSKKKQNNMPFNSRARIETALYRIEDTLKYMNTIPLGTNPQRMQAFDFYDFVNCEVVVIDCIEMLGHIFGCESDISKLNLNYSRQSRDSG